MNIPTKEDTHVNEGLRVKEALLSFVRQLPLNANGVPQVLGPEQDAALDEIVAGARAWINATDLLAQGLLTYDYGRFDSDHGILRTCLILIRRETLLSQQPATTIESIQKHFGLAFKILKSIPQMSNSPEGANGSSPSVTLSIKANTAFILM